MKTILRLLLCTCLMTAPLVLLAQVTTPEKVPEANQNTRFNTSNERVHLEAVAPMDLEVAEAAGTLNAAGYLALFQEIRKHALAKNRNTVPPRQQLQLEQVVNRLENKYPQSFEYHCAAYYLNRYDTAGGSHLREAHRLAPANKALLSELVALAELSSDPKQKLEYCRKIETQKVYDPLLYHYGRNLLTSVEAGGWLITQGEWDTYPVWVLQSVHRFRTDVTLLQLDLLHQQHYFERVMAPFKLKKGAYKRFVANPSSFLKELAVASKPVYLSLTVDQNYITQNGSILFTTGLAMKVSQKPFDNLPLLVEHWKSFDLTNLPSTKADKELNKMLGNYIMPAGLLYQKALTDGRTGEADTLRVLMTGLARNAGRSAEMEQFLKSSGR
jgi:hypothetical protein